MYVMPEDNDAEAEETMQKQTSPLDDAEHLEELYHGEGLTQAEIGERYGVTSSTVSHYMKKHDVSTRANVIDDERLEDPEWLANAYLGEEDGGEGEEMTMQDIADEVGCSDGTVMRRLHKFDIPVRRSSAEKAEDEAEEADEEAEDEAEAPADD
jgi:transcriptional regulator with XRE-family HTH domain